MEKKKKAKIPKLEIEKFTFSPPGSMGWSYSEYESMMKNPEKVLNESAVHENLVELKAAELMEFPFGPKSEYNWEADVAETSTEMSIENESPEEILGDFAVSFMDLENESIESYDYAAHAEMESADEWEEAEESREAEEEPVAEGKKQIIIVTMEPPKPPWIASNLK